MTTPYSPSRSGTMANSSLAKSAATFVGILCLAVAVFADSLSPPKNRTKIISCYPECTLTIVKPDGVERGLIGDIITRFENKGLKLQAMKFMHADRPTVEVHYGKHAGRDFFESLVDYILSGPVVPMVWEGPNVIQYVRKIIGSPDEPEFAALKDAPGTIRGDYSLDFKVNLVHASSFQENPKGEIHLWFPEYEIVSLPEHQKGKE